MSRAKTHDSILSPISGRWQIPLFLIGTSAFAAGMGKMVLDHHPMSFDEELRIAQKLRDGGELPRASAFLMFLLNEKKHEPIQRAKLHLELAHVIHKAEASLHAHDPRNVEAIVLNTDEAIRDGVEPQAHDWAAVGDAYRWSSQLKAAVKAYQIAIERNVKRPDRLHRAIVELKQAIKGGKAEGVEKHIDAILGDQTASPDNYLWAVERKVRELLDRGDPAAAMHVVTEAKRQLAGTEYLPVVSYSEALTLRNAGLRDEAIDLLHSLREEWGVRDELWARAGMLLGKMEQEDARPQSALSYYEDVLKSFQDGDIHEICTLGRAECMASLERFDEALDVFRKVRDIVRNHNAQRSIDRENVRMGMTRICDELARRKRWALSIEYLETALDLVDGEDGSLRVWYLSRLATALNELGERHLKEQETGDKVPAGRFKEDFERAAKICFELAQLTFTNDEASAEWMEKAATYLGQAGQTDQMIHTLERVVDEYPLATGRANAMYRLGAAYQARGEYAIAKKHYRKVIETYSRTPPALEAIVPLADCLVSLGGDDTIEGVRMLMDIVDDRGPDQLFAPNAREYHQALLLLAQYYSDADAKVTPDHVEKAIVRLEDALNLYPNDSEVPRLRFLLAQNYRRSAASLREDAEKLTSPLARSSTLREADRRLERAAEEYDRVVRLLAAEDASSLTELQQTYLRSGYLDRGDVLFDLGKYQEAIVAYREAAWRYENTPTSLAAMLQVVNCHQRLGEIQQARAALARLDWLLKKTPESAFDPNRGMSSKEYWENLIARLERTAIN